MLQRTNRPIYRAYLLKEALAACLDRRVYVLKNARRHGEAVGDGRHLFFGLVLRRLAER